MDISRYSWGIELCIGLPGSGKSFWAVREALRCIVDGRRPVFSNLPFNWRVLRQWLRNRGGEELARLAYELDDNGEHFKRFLARSAERAKFRATWQAEQRNAGKPTHSGAFERAWVEKAGPNILRGPDANWILSTACIIIDEAHKWYPGASYQKDREGTDLLAYATMCRHYVHRVIIITQRPMQVSKTLRGLAENWWFVRNRKDDKLVWGLRFGHFGVRAIAYVRANADMIDGKEESFTATGERPVGDQYTVFPWLPQYRYIFRLYRSFTHVGSPRALRRDLERARIDAGLSIKGVSEAEASGRGVDPMAKPRLIKRLAVRGVAAGLLFGTGFVAAVASAPPAPAVVEPPSDATTDEPAERVWPQWKSYGEGWVRLGDKRVEAGGEVDGIRVIAVDVANRRLLLGADGYYWLWLWRKEQPYRAASVADVTERIGARVGGGDRSAGRGSQPAATGGVGGGVGAPPDYADVER